MPADGPLTSGVYTTINSEEHVFFNVHFFGWMVRGVPVALIPEISGNTVIINKSNAPPAAAVVAGGSKTPSEVDLVRYRGHAVFLH